MKNHPLTVTGYHGTLKDLARDIMNMRYDKVAEFLTALEEHCNADAAKDEAAGHPKVATLLKEAAHDTLYLTEDFKNLWELCEPHEPASTQAVLPLT